MATVVADAWGQRAPATRHREAKGVAANRAAYDRRRRAVRHDAQTQAYVWLLKHDPCARCGRRFSGEGERNAADHIVSLRADGRDSWENMTSLCRRCNASKKDRPLLLWLIGEA